ncbi:MAG: hypothetical protein IPN93_04610 [Bacteroidetes bacterium]|nr:hypothetical protein [Bacteroidota bacterium]
MKHSTYKYFGTGKISLAILLLFFHHKNPTGKKHRQQGISKIRNPVLNMLEANIKVCSKGKIAIIKYTKCLCLLFEKIIFQHTP